MGNFNNLMSPLKIGPVELKNRYVVAPMNETFAGVRGEATAQYIAYFAARAKGGFGLLTTGAIMGTKLASKFVWGRNPYMFSPLHIQGMSLFNETCHHFGAQTAAQMTIGFGRQGHSDNHHELVPAATGGLPYEIAIEKGAHPLVAPSMKTNDLAREFLYGQNTFEMSIDLIHSEQKEFAQSCQLAIKSGFDVIDIHAPHGYLEHQFLSPLSNKRTDMYGGSWRNRKRFLIEIAEQVRYAAGKDVAVGCRISAEEHCEGGLTREEMIDVAQDLQALGCDYISLSDGGGYEESGHLIPDPERWAHQPDCAAEFKKALKIPAILVGAHDPVLAESIVAEGKADLIALGRQSFCDPELPNKVAAGKIEDIIKCKRCNICLARANGDMGGPRCPFNPMLGREFEFPEYHMGPRRPDEPLFPRGAMSMPSLNHAWWRSEIPYTEKFWIPFRGPGSR
ncbi:NADH:flavin oxidoreductase [Desulfosporosinus shakirovi]|uniref:NADH:flavin oxidoreductase n=1 Tax=Desulfosporosinus shakirovi TaxID=2885154 RepID=UPI001E659CA7|nr:NADH:flavin oxidoreductase [Desulfosporosinus sp. SRJS8]MCB8817836.1 NADH:flavin oxidoreductase [Desulfosporosinus sp. SRJS8]